MMITIDTDWASQELIAYTAGIFSEHNAKSTWFITNRNPAVLELLRQKELFDVGIHPNFFPGSTQGNTVKEVMDYLLDIAPEAQAMRTHALYQSSHMFRLIIEKYSQIKADVSLFIPYGENLTGHRLYLSPQGLQRSIYRMPYIWEDDFEIFAPHPNFEFEISNFSKDGLKIFNFHPIHIALNSNSWDNYMNLKKSYDVSTVDLEDVFKFRNSNGLGAEDFLRGMLSNKTIDFVHIREKVLV